MLSWSFRLPTGGKAVYSDWTCRGAGKKLGFAGVLMWQERVSYVYWPLPDGEGPRQR